MAAAGNQAGINAKLPPAKAPAANITTGNNPRGVAIVNVKQTPPVVKAAPKVNVVRAVPNAALRYTPAAIQSQKALGAFINSQPLSGPAKVASTLAKQIVGLPASSLMAGEQIAPALGELVSGNPNPAAKLAKESFNYDPIVRSIKTGSLAPLAADPLGTAFDASLIYGGVGRAAGIGDAVARGEALSDAIKGGVGHGSRAPLEAAPGVPGTAVARGVSPNLFTRAFQNLWDAKGGNVMPVARAERALKQQVATQHAAEVGQRGAEEAHVIKGMAGVKPPGLEEQNATALTAGFGVGPDKLDAIRQEIARSPEPIDPVKAEQRIENLKNLEAIGAKHAAGQFNEPAVNLAAEIHAALRGGLEDEKAHLGLRDSTEMERSLDKRRALLEPNVHNLDTPTTNPVLVNAVKEAKDANKTAQENLKIATRERAATLGAHVGASRTLADIAKRIPVAENTSSLTSHALDLRGILSDSLERSKPYHDARVAYRQQAADTAAENLMVARKAVTAKQNKLTGAVIEDPNMPALTSGKLKGLRVRPVTADDMAKIRENDPATQSFVSLRNPDVAGAKNMQTHLGLPGDVTVPHEHGVQPYTGDAILGGEFRPGWSAMTNSLLRDVRGVSAAREWKNFLDRFSIPDEEGFTTHTSRDTAAALGHAYKQRTGLDTELLSDQAGGIHVVPKAASDELAAQWKKDQPQGLAKGVVKMNRLFRKTVLPYSPKLPVMHTIESGIRTGLHENGNLLRVPGDARLGHQFLDALPPGQHSRLAATLTPGSLSRSGAAGEAEDLGKLSADRGQAATVAHNVGQTVGEVGTQIIRLQRSMEKSSQVVALGHHLRDVVAESGRTFEDANAKVEYLVNHFNDPAAADRAARAIHTWLGQYNSFTAGTRLALRGMPFASWYMNAAKLVMVTLPRDHPMLSVIMHDVNEATQKDWDQQHAGLPFDLQSAVKDGSGWLDVGKFSPAEQLPLTLQGLGTTAAGLPLPWLTGSALALAGKDPFLSDLVGSTHGIMSGGKGSLTSGASAVENFLESIGGPINDVARGLFGQGGTMTNSSTPVLHLAGLGHVTVKPGTTTQQRGVLNLPGPLDKVLDPFHPTTIGGGSSAGLAGASGGSLAGATAGSLAGATGGSLAGAK